MLQAGSIKSFPETLNLPPQPPVFPDRTVTTDAAEYLWNSHFQLVKQKALLVNVKLTGGLINILNS